MEFKLIEIIQTHWTILALYTKIDVDIIQLSWLIPRQAGPGQVSQGRATGGQGRAAAARLGHWVVAAILSESGKCSVRRRVMASDGWSGAQVTSGAGHQNTGDTGPGHTCHQWPQVEAGHGVKVIVTMCAESWENVDKKLQEGFIFSCSKIVKIFNTSLLTISE